MELGKIHTRAFLKEEWELFKAKRLQALNMLNVYHSN